MIESLAAGTGNREAHARASRARRWGAVWALAGTFALSATPAIAADPAPTAQAAQATQPAADSPIARARAAWDKGSLTDAEPLYREALEKGGLAPSEVLEGYVRLGSIRAAGGKKDAAVAAFRAASILDANFVVPSEAGSKAPALAEKAKKDTAKIGSIQLTMKAPKETASGKAFTISAQLDAAHVPIVSNVGLVARDGTSGKEVKLEVKPDQTLELEVAADVTLPGASILVRVDALDKNKNRLASVEEHVKVPDAAPAPVAVAPHPKEKPRKKGFWSSPWPYVIGGAALAGAGAAVYLGTRPPDDVTVGQIGVHSR